MATTNTGAVFSCNQEIKLPNTRELVPPSAAGLTMLKDGYQRSLGDPQNDGRLAILRAIGGYREPAATTGFMQTSLSG